MTTYVRAIRIRAKVVYFYFALKIASDLDRIFKQIRPQLILYLCVKKILLKFLMHREINEG